MRQAPSRRKRYRLPLLVAIASTAVSLLFISTHPIEPSNGLVFGFNARNQPDRGGEAGVQKEEQEDREGKVEVKVVEGREGKVEVKIVEGQNGGAACATVEKMGEAFAGSYEKVSLRVREVIKRHFDLHGAARVRELPADQFCREGFVIGKASEAGFGNEMYKILTAAALSVMLNRSLIIGQTRGRYPFEDYISYANHSFALKEIKHLWKKHDCAGKFGRKLVIRIDNFEHPENTNVLCSDWKGWKQPIIWFQGTTDAVAIQFFLKNLQPEMRNAALNLFGLEESLQSRPNVFGELMRAILSPTQAIEKAIDWVLQGVDPDVVLHMRMMTNRSVRAMQAALQCIKRAISNMEPQDAKPRVALVSDTPSFITEITPYLTEFAEVIYFDYKLFQGNTSSWSVITQQQSDFRRKDWGPAPRWVALVDFFLASRAKHAVVTGAHRRIGTTYAQLIAALAAANQHGKYPSGSNFSFFSSFQSNLLVHGLGNQLGWGHVWNRFGGPSSCHHQPHQCALTPLLPPAWWDGKWQSPILRDIERLKAYGVSLSVSGEVIQSDLLSFCRSKEYHVKTVKVFTQ